MVGDLTAVLTGFWPHVDEVVGLAHDGFVVFDNDQGVSFVAEIVHDLCEAVDVAVVEADGGFVENEESLGQCRSQTGSEVDAGDFATAQGTGRAVQGEVAQANFAKVIEAGGDLGEDEVGGFVVAF